MSPTENYLVSRTSHTILATVKEGEEEERAIKTIAWICCFSQAVFLLHLIH
jgi:hypothetical protein